MSQRPKCAEGWWPNIGRMLIQLVVQALVDDVLVVQAVQLVNEALDVCRYLYQEGMPMVVLGMGGYDNLGKARADRQVRHRASSLRSLQHRPGQHALQHCLACAASSNRR